MECHTENGRSKGIEILKKTMNLRDKQREETKKRIYECAFKLFEEKGFHNVKVQDIANEAGISIGGLYHHYKSKEDIIDYGYYTFDEDLQEHYENQKIHSPAEGIHVLIGYQMQTCVDRGYEIITITFRNQMQLDNTYRYSNDRYLTQMIRENLKKAGLDEQTAEEAVTFILRTSRGCVYDWCCKKGNFALKEETLKQIDMILEHYRIKI